MVSRREVLSMAVPAAAWLANSSLSHAAPVTGKPKMGGTPTAFAIRARAARAGGGRFDIVEHCHRLGLGQVQANPPATDPETIKKFRERLEAYNMYLISDARLPRAEADVPAFEAQVKACKEAGAVAFHAAMTGRRYEDFDSLEPFKRMFEGAKKSVELAEPVFRRHRVRLGIENHKGWRAAEQAEWMKKLGSEWIGVCLDFGNNLSLCEDPLDTARTLAPYTFFAHIKDMGVEEYPDGFMLSEVPLGDGFLDLKGIVAMLRERDPNMMFELEMITRDPLKIPVYTPKYWATFDDTYSPLPGRDLAKVLALVKKNKPKKPLPRTTGLGPEAQLKAEDEYNLACIEWGRKNLDL